MAQAIFVAEAARRKLNVTVLSAGIWDMEGMVAAERAQYVCNLHGTPMTKLEAVHHVKLDLTEAVRVFVMEPRHKGALEKQTAVLPERISLLGQFDPLQRGEAIEDPVGMPTFAFEACYARLRTCIVHYLDTTRELT
jgi:protein-tyrosine-phosphatase